MRHRIVVDVDGVLADFVHSVLRIAERLWPGRVPRDYQPEAWDFPDLFTKSDWNAIWQVIGADRWFWMDSKAYGDNVRAMTEFLRHRNDDIFFITSRMDTGGNSALFQTRLWLTGNGINENRTTVIPVPEPGSKKPIVEAIKADYSIDDYPPTVSECLSIGGGHQAFLLDRPWNRDQNQGGGLPRVRNLEQFLDVVRRGLGNGQPTVS